MSVKGTAILAAPQGRKFVASVGAFRSVGLGRREAIRRLFYPTCRVNTDFLFRRWRPGWACGGIHESEACSAWWGCPAGLRTDQNESRCGIVHDAKIRRFSVRSGARILRGREGGRERIHRGTGITTKRADQSLGRKMFQCGEKLRSFLAPQIIFHIGSPAGTQRGSLGRLPECTCICKSYGRDSGTKSISTMKNTTYC